MSAPRQYDIALTAGSSCLAQAQDATGIAELPLLASKGAVWIVRGGRGKPRRIRALDVPAAAADRLLINYNPVVLAQTAPMPELISDQGDYSIWDKPSGVTCQGSKWGDHCAITSLAATVSGKPSMLVHRLDRAASGLIIIAHTRTACRLLAGLFAERQLQKTYTTSVYGRPRQPLPWLLTQPVNGKSALTRVVNIESVERSEEPRSRLTVEIETGRKHQIRVHLASAGFPVVGDRLYDANRNHREDLQLRATGLQFVCPLKSNSICIKIGT